MKVPNATKIISNPGPTEFSDVILTQSLDDAVQKRRVPHIAATRFLVSAELLFAQQTINIFIP